MSIEQDLSRVLDTLSKSVDVLAELAVVNANDFPDAAEVVSSVAQEILSIIDVLDMDVLTSALADQRRWNFIADLHSVAWADDIDEQIAADPRPCKGEVTNG